MKDYRVFSAQTIKRMLGERDYEKFVENYQKHTGNRERAVTPTDLRMLEDYKNGHSYRSLAKKYGVPASSVMTAIRIAALSRI